ncbi:MAG: CaiB/BaiF CoA transferase family protein [Alphaproteobacteria bacterium]
MTTDLPLADIRIIDLTQVMLGPCATQMLGDFGANVIKIERPGFGDLSRTSIESAGHGDNPVFLSLNRNKRSIALNLRSEEGQAIVHDLVRTADVIVNNFRPGVMDRLNIGYDKLAEINPRIIFGFGSGFGSSGPYMHKGGQDVLAQAMSGVMARKADPSHPLAVYATAMCDYSAGMHLVQGILVALLGREKTGRGQQVEVSLYDSMIAMQMQEASTQMMRDVELNWAAMPLSGVFETTDGALVLVGAFKKNPLQDICAALDIDDISGQYPTLEVQRANRDHLQQIFHENFATNTTEYWLERLEAQDLLCAPVRTLEQALVDPQTIHNGMVVEIPYNGGTAKLVGSPVHLSDAPLDIRHAPPRLGEHSKQILAELGYEQGRIDALQDAGIIA